MVWIITWNDQNDCERSRQNEKVIKKKKGPEPRSDVGRFMAEGNLDRLGMDFLIVAFRRSFPFSVISEHPDMIYSTFGVFHTEIALDYTCVSLGRREHLFARRSKQVVGMKPDVNILVGGNG